METYTITYNGLENSTGAESNPTSYTAQSNDITLTNPTKIGYNFTGWTGTGLSDKTMLVIISAGSLGDRTYTANWTAKEYKISFDLNGGELEENKTNPTSYDIESDNFKPSNPSKDGYAFEGWLLSGDTSMTISNDLTIPNGSTGDREYIAQWSLIEYLISYTLNGGAATNPTSYTIESDDINLNKPTKTGYKFAGWTGTEIDSSSADVTIPKGSLGDREYTATWTANTYTVKFETQDGNGSMSDQLFTYDVEQALNNNAFTLAGYSFNGWKDNDNDKTYSEGETVKNLTATDGAIITLYAQWKINQYTKLLTRRAVLKFHR